MIQDKDCFSVWWRAAKSWQPQRRRETKVMQIEKCVLSEPLGPAAFGWDFTFQPQTASKGTLCFVMWGFLSLTLPLCVGLQADPLVCCVSLEMGWREKYWRFGNQSHKVRLSIAWVVEYLWNGESKHDDDLFSLDKWANAKHMLDFVWSSEERTEIINLLFSCGATNSVTFAPIKPCQHEGLGSFHLGSFMNFFLYVCSSALVGCQCCRTVRRRPWTQRW